jgi:cobalt-zinc-cadmium efflux system protein
MQSPGRHRESHLHEGPLYGAVSEDASRSRLLVALALIAGFMVAEVVAGIVASSLALVSDAAHMLTDAAAIVVSLIALYLVGRPARGNFTFGLRRAEILSAQVNGAALLVLAGLIVYEAVQRLIAPADVGGWMVIAVALAGIGVNLVATWQLAKANRENMAVEGSFRHLLTDLYAFIGTLIAGIVIVITGFDRADPIVSLGVAALMVWAAYGLLRSSGRVLLEMSPAGLDVPEIARAITDHPHVSSVHDLHVWQIGSGFPALSAHVLVHPGDDCHRIRRELERMLVDRFEIDHTTLQVDHERPRLLTVESRNRAHQHGRR